jgi:sulfur carrier protein ThiS
LAQSARDAAETPVSLAPDTGRDELRCATTLAVLTSKPMASVVVSFTGPVRRPRGVPVRGEHQVPPGGTIEALLDSLGYDAGDRTHLRAVVDGRTVPLGSRLEGGETITVFMPVGGG